MLERTLYNVEFWKHLSIPFVAGIVGWGTNWIAIRLTFRPLEFVGIRPFLGWQGIIPSKAGKMARIFVDKTMFRLGTLKELFQSMEPDEIAHHITEMMEPRLDDFTNEIMFYNHPTLWQMLPQVMKERVYAQVRREMPSLVDGLMKETAERIEDVIDFKDMLVRRLEGDRSLLNRLFIEAGSVEFAFIIRSGLYFGFLFGIIQLTVWIFFKAWWVLPFFGALVGYSTNWFAINIVFRPLRPTRIGPWTIQGLFLKRQREVAATWCKLVTTEILTLQQIIYSMVHGTHSERTEALIRKHVEPVSERVIASFGKLGDLAVSDEVMEQIKRSVGQKAVKVSTDAFDHWPFNRNRARLAERLLRERMEELPPEEFQDLLRPCFQEDEMKLIIMGGVLGLLAGIAQLLLVFGGFGG